MSILNCLSVCAPVPRKFPTENAFLVHEHLSSPQVEPLLAQEAPSRTPRAYRLELSPHRIELSETNWQFDSSSWKIAS